MATRWVALRDRASKFWGALTRPRDQPSQSLVAESIPSIPTVSGGLGYASFPASAQSASEVGRPTSFVNPLFELSSGLSLRRSSTRAKTQTYALDPRRLSDVGPSAQAPPISEMEASIACLLALLRHFNLLYDC